MYRAFIPFFVSHCVHVERYYTRVELFYVRGTRQEPVKVTVRVHFPITGHGCLCDKFSRSLIGIGQITKGIFKLYRERAKAAKTRQLTGGLTLISCENKTVNWRLSLISS